jgi:hypothetical protein
VRSRGLAAFVAVWIALVVTGCQEAQATPELLSAGGEYDVGDATIVAHTAIPTDLPTWTIADSAALRIGRVEGGGPDVFGRILGVATTSGGGIVVGDARAFEVRAFDSSGTFLWRAGREGSGPGEFRLMGGLFVAPGDSVVVVERGNPRLTVFAPDGRHVRTDPLQYADAERFGPLEYRGFLEDGTAIATTRQRDGSVIESDFRRFLHALVYVPRGRPPHRPGPAFFDEILFEQELQLPIREGADPVPVIRMQSPPVAGSAVYAVAGDRVAVGIQGQAEIVVYDAEARPIRVFRMPPGAPTDRDRITEYVSTRYEEAFGRTPREQADLYAQQLPDTLPGFERILYDAAGRLWVEEYVPVYEDRTPTWWVLDEAGAFVAQSRLPARFTPSEIHEGHVIGIALDSLDVGSVERRPILRPPPRRTP